MKTIPIRPVAGDASPARPKGDGRWCWGRLLTAPHRLGFFAGALMLAFSALWWSGVLIARSAGLALPWAVSPPAAHALLMSLGFMPFFMVGFLFTAGPRWLRLPAVDARQLRAAVLWMLAGWAVAVTGFHTQALVLATGLAAVALGWSALCRRFVVLIHRSREADTLHARLIALACCAGAACLWVAVLSAALGQELLLRSAMQVAIWCFAATVFAVAAHRMIPFYGGGLVPWLDKRYPMWLLWALPSALSLQAPLAVAELVWRPLPSALQAVRAALELGVAALLLCLAWHWGRLQNLKIRMLAMLHGGLLWLGAAFALAAGSHALMALTGGALSLGLAPMHALSMGFMGSTWMAMVTRVSSAHSGRPVAADDIAWRLYGLLQAAVVLRVAGALWPAGAAALVVLAALVWCAATVGWAVRHGRWLGQARVDGRDT